MDTNDTATAAPESQILNKTQMDYNDVTAAAFISSSGTKAIMSTNNTNYSIKTSPFNSIPWAHRYLSNPITHENAPATNMARISQKITGTMTISNTSDISINTSRPVGASDIQSDCPRVRSVSFSLPKRSCVLLHQSAAVFIQAGRSSDLSGKLEGVMAQERVKDFEEKIVDQELKLPVSADVDHWDTGKQCSLDKKRAIPHTEAFARPSAEMGSGAQISLCNHNAIRVEDSDISENGSQLSQCNNNVSGDQASRESGTEAHLYLKSKIPGQTSPRIISTVMFKGSVSRGNEENPTWHLKDTFYSIKNLPQKTISGVLNEIKDTSVQTKPKESSFSTSNFGKGSTLLPPSRLKEPFCHVWTRDGSRALLWPSEMVSYTKSPPTISYSINPLLYDFRAHIRAKEVNENKKGWLEEESERIEPSVIKRPDCQQSQEVMEGEREGKTDEKVGSK